MTDSSSFTSLSIKPSLSIDVIKTIESKPVRTRGKNGLLCIDREEFTSRHDRIERRYDTGEYIYQSNPRRPNFINSMESMESIPHSNRRVCPWHSLGAHSSVCPDHLDAGQLYAPHSAPPTVVTVCAPHTAAPYLAGQLSAPAVPAPPTVVTVSAPAVPAPPTVVTVMTFSKDIEVPLQDGK